MTMKKLMLLLCLALSLVLATAGLADEVPAGLIGEWEMTGMVGDGQVDADEFGSSSMTFTETELTIQLGVQGLQTLAFGYICFSVTQVLQGSMRGAGETKLPMYISIIGTVILRMPLAYLMAALTKNETWPNGQPIALFGSLLISWVVSMMMTVVSYRMKFWRKKLGTLGDEI